jgi:amidophosphoribosyltransferase
MAWLHGAYSVVVLTPRQLVAFRDPNGVRPLCLGSLDGVGTVFASETCALNVVGAKFQREMEPGEVVVVDFNGVREMTGLPGDRPAMCLFEFIYLARPDSHIYGRSLHKSRYIGRTFIEPDQRMRELGVRMKLNPLRENLAGRRVVMVDDSIVRGTTTGQIVRLLKEAGATQALAEIERQVGADSLGYLSLRGVLNAVGVHRDKFCHACFTGDYPIEVPRDLQASKYLFEEPALV